MNDDKINPVRMMILYKLKTKALFFLGKIAKI